MRFGDSAGKVLGGRYLLIAPIGRGASGDVYLARDRTLDRKVAIKLLHANLAGDPVFTKRFRAEATSAAALNHPSIMRVFDWGESSGTPYLVLEFLSGGSLREYLAGTGVLDVEQSATLALQTSQGLAYAHSRGYVHRDLKPANLLFDDEGRVRIADFGLARSLSEAAWTEPVGVLLGTARYASPEMAQGKDSSVASDVYSFGLVVYESVLGRLPFAGDTTVATLMARIGVDVEPPAELGILAEVVRRCCRAEPLERYSAAELQAELERIVRKLDPPTPLVLSPWSDPVGVGPDQDETTIFAPTPENPQSVLAGADVAMSPTSNLFDLESVSLAAAAVAGGEVGLGGSEVITSIVTDGDVKVKKKRRWKLPFGLALLVVVALLIGAVASGLVKVFPPTKVLVPSVASSSLSSAKADLAKVGLIVKVTQHPFSSTVPAGFVVSEVPKAGTLAIKGSAVDLAVSAGHAPVQIPAVSGVSASIAESRLTSVGLGYSLTQVFSETINAGVVIAGQPSSGSIPYGSTVQLTVSKGPALRLVPDLGGVSSQQAKSQLQQLKLVASLVNTYSDTVPVGTVISTVPAAGAYVARGSTITVDVSQGPHLVQVPNVLGDTIAQAEAALANVGLSVATTYGPPNSTRALGTDPPAATTVHYGSSVDLYAF